jgi:flagellar L-ring protein precursor FlgH
MQSHATRWFGFVLVATLGATVGAGQNNSMLSGEGATEAQPAERAGEPAAGQRVIPLTGATASQRPRETPRETAPVENPTIHARSPYAVAPPEPREFQIGDIVTIIVREIRESSSEADLKEEKEWTLESALNKWIRLNGDNNLVPQNFEEGTPGVDFNFSNEYEGTGESEREDTLTLRISARVVDIKPNNVLVVEAKKRIKVDEDEQITTLIGKCRTEDVTATNTVLSTQMADVEIVASNTGPVRDGTRRGWLMRLFDLIRPL